jgi:hypothetical protein
LNRGEGAGLEVGDVKEVVSTSEEMVDPSAGKLLGAAEGSLGKNRITRISQKFSVAVPVGELGVEPEAGDTVLQVRERNRPTGRVNLNLAAGERQFNRPWGDSAPRRRGGEGCGSFGHSAVAQAPPLGAGNDLAGRSSQDWGVTQRTG